MSSRSRCSRHAGWERYCLRPRSSIPVAWMGPRGSGQTHTRFHAGGIASSEIRSITSRSAIGVPSSSA